VEDLSSIMKHSINGNGNGSAKAVTWRRTKVLELTSQGNSQVEIARVLCVGEATISRDLSYLRQQAQENMQKHIQQKLPEEYQRCLTGMNQVLKLSWQIANNINGRQNSQDHNDNNGNTLTTGDERTRLQALSLINDCYKYIMDLTTNGVVITDAIKFVQTNKEKLTAMSTNEKGNGKESKEPDYDEDEDENQLEERQEEETGEVEEETTNRVF
jgi:IS30 family transposase